MYLIGEKMKKVFLILILLSGFINVFYAREKSVKINPQKPGSGSEITVIYNPEGTALTKAGSIEMRAYLWSNNIDGKIEKVSSVEMKKEGNEWSARFKTSNMTDLAALLFVGDDKIENNEGKGYFVRFYDAKGNETLGSRMGYAIAIADLNWGRNTLNLNPDFKNSCSLMDEIFIKEPDQKRKNFEYYIPAFLLSKKDKKEETIGLLEKELDQFLNYKDLTDKEYKSITENFSRFRFLEKAKSAKEKAIAKYPNGLVAFAKRIESLSLDNNLASEVERIDKECPGNRDSRELYSLIQKVLAEKKIDCLKDMLQKNSWMLENGSICSVIVNHYLTEEINFDGLKDINEKYMQMVKKDYEKPISERENSVTEKQEINKRKKQYAYGLFTYAEILSRLGQKEIALESFEKGTEILPLTEMAPKYFEWYLKNLVDNNQLEKAGPLLETCIKLGRANEGIKNLNKEYYIKKNKTEAGYNEYMASLSGAAKNKTEEDLQKKMTNTPAPNFTLFDLEGKEIKLSALKGKIVILDFWATWCGPCKASFPFMKKAVEKYANNPNVLFLFVSTMENDDNATEKIKKFIKDNNYPFHVLLDKDSKVSASYGVKGIPSKVFIDKNGKNRLFSIGFNEISLLDEIDYMINFLK